MRNVLFCSALGLSGVMLAFVVPACSSSTAVGPSQDGGTNPDTGVSPVTDSGGNPVTDSGGKPGTDSGPITPVDAGPWAPSNFTLAQVGTVTPIAVTQPAGDSDACTVSTDDGTWSCNVTGGLTAPPFVQVTLAGAAGSATVWVMSSFTLGTSNKMTINGAKAAIFYVTGPVEIDGPITATAGGLSAGVGVGGTGNPSGNPVTGAGGGSFCGLGGAGFPMEDAGAAVGPAAVPGVAYGTANLIPLLGGSAGGATGYNGGSGGGGFQITSGTSITITAAGSILAGGTVPANYATGINWLRRRQRRCHPPRSSGDRPGRQPLRERRRRRGQSGLRQRGDDQRERGPRRGNGRGRWFVWLGAERHRGYRRDGRSLCRRRRRRGRVHPHQLVESDARRDHYPVDRGRRMRERRTVVIAR